MQASAKVPASVNGMVKSGDCVNWAKLDLERLILTLDTWISSPTPSSHLGDPTPP